MKNWWPRSGSPIHKIHGKQGNNMNENAGTSFDKRLRRFQVRAPPQTVANSRFSSLPSYYKITFARFELGFFYKHTYLPCLSRGQCNTEVKFWKIPTMVLITWILANLYYFPGITQRVISGIASHLNMCALVWYQKTLHQTDLKVYSHISVKIGPQELPTLYWNASSDRKIKLLEADECGHFFALWLSTPANFTLTSNNVTAWLSSCLMNHMNSCRYL